MRFFQCQNCLGVHRDPKETLTPMEEKARYDTHRNDLDDSRYINYMTESLSDFKKLIPKGATVLDFGCGPTKCLEFIFKNEKFKVQSWDKYYYSEPLKGPFDCIVCHEVVEHFVDTQLEWQKLLEWGKSGSLFYVRTELYPIEPDSFKTWYYKNDLTHTFFYHQKTFDYLSEEFKLKNIARWGNNKWVFQT